ncbi:hypothetical protein [Amycolatopsis circi]|uniref:hypothetical protein n=1 Tax=Amycolatopsis circi TaxID=871959 RepID=UPI000E238477|nr:hypothetical protein [Amycolatopsis circi]
MTVVPCLADQPSRAGQQRRTGEPPEPEESVLVREPQPNPPSRPHASADGPEPGPGPRGAAKLERLVEPAKVTQVDGGTEQRRPLRPDEAADAVASNAAEPASAEAISASPAQSCDAAAGHGAALNLAEASSTDPALPSTTAATEAAGSNAAEPNRPEDPSHPDPEHPSRVRVVVDWDPFSRPPRRIATRDEMVASAHWVLARRQRGRHRKPDSRDPWASRAADFVVTWASTLRTALLLLAGTAFLTGLVLMDSPIAGVAVTSATLAAGVAAWVARPRRSPSHRC